MTAAPTPSAPVGVAGLDERLGPLLELEGISKRFGGVQALTDVDFHVNRGEVVAVVGDNGAGKSTLIKVIAGSHVPDAGEVRFAGKTVTIHRPADATALGIATVYQDLALCDNLNVIANLHLGREELSFGKRLNDGAMERRSLEILKQLSVTIPNPKLPVGALSGGQRQAIAVARCVVFDAQLVVMDEPTAALGVEQTGQVLELIHRLKARGISVVVISHNLADVFEVADRVVVLRLGRKVADVMTEEVTREQIVGLITGALDAGAIRASV